MGITLEPYRVEPETDTSAAVFALYRRVFGADRSADEWKWRYIDNPAAESVTIIARDDAQTLVGHQAVTPVQINVRGKPVLGGQSGDSMVDPNCRGGGVFEKLLRASHDGARDRAMALVYGFPGPMSLPIFLQKVAWDRVAQLTDYRFVIDYRASVRRVLRVAPLVSLATALLRGWSTLRTRAGQALAERGNPNTAYRTSATLPEGYAAFWKVVARGEIFSVWKDTAYMAWRYDANPTQRYRYHWLERDGAIVSLAVTRSEGGQWLITELMATVKTAPDSPLLLWHILGDACRAGASAVVFQGSDSGYFDRAFAMFRRTVDLDKVFAIYTIAEDSMMRGATLTQNWTVSLGDWDGV